MQKRIIVYRKYNGSGLKEILVISCEKKEIESKQEFMQKMEKYVEDHAIKGDDIVNYEARVSFVYLM